MLVSGPSLASPAGSRCCWTPRYLQKVVLVALINLTNVEVYEYLFVPEGSEGFLVNVQDHRDFPMVNEESLLVGPGAEVNIGLGAEVIKTSNDSINRFTPDQRKCYTDQEIDLYILPHFKVLFVQFTLVYQFGLHKTFWD